VYRADNTSPALIVFLDIVLKRHNREIAGDGVKKAGVHVCCKSHQPESAARDQV
jgi:hypothetical protein